MRRRLRVDWFGQLDISVSCNKGWSLELEIKVGIRNSRLRRLSDWLHINYLFEDVALKIK